MRSNFPKDNVDDLNAFYGRMDIGPDGLPSRRWEASNLCTADLPYMMQLAWDKSVAVRRICCNKMIRRTLFSCLERIKSSFTPAEIKELGLDQWGGCYCFRSQRRSHRLSVHAWAAAIDLNPMQNPPGKTGNMPEGVVKIFEDEGWEWGGRWKNADPMHFQCALNGK